MKPSFHPIPQGTVTTPAGFFASGISCGIKPSRKPDLALLISDPPAEVAATFTTNQVKAAPVRVSMQHAKNGRIRGVLANSGNANACTGVVGLKNSMRMVAETANAIGGRSRDYLVCSTGRIGVPLPMSKIISGIRKASKSLSHKAGHDAAKAIMTSDTRPKEYAVQLEIDGKTVTIGGIAKGAGMIHPNMATMLCFVTTDAVIDKKSLQRCVDDAVEMTFNRISIDGDTSTNDTVIVLANGRAGNNPLKSYHPSRELFRKALQHVMQKLARMMVEDGEGITRVVEVCVKGAATHADAKAAAQSIATSLLVKTSWCGGDPNWGRLMDAIGYSSAKIREELVEIYYDGLLAVSNGRQSNTPMSKLRKITKKKAFTITIHLHLGTAEYSLLSNDLTEKYVEINKGE